MGHRDSRHKILADKQKQKVRVPEKKEPPPPKRPRQMSAGRRTKLLKRVKKADGKLVRDTLIGGIVVLLITCGIVTPFSWLGLKDGGWVGILAGTCMFTILGMFFLIVLIVFQMRVNSLARTHDLVCQNCGEPLLNLPRARDDHPDNRPTFQLPKRCPYCHEPIASVAPKE